MPLDIVVVGDSKEDCRGIVYGVDDENDWSYYHGSHPGIIYEIMNNPPDLIVFLANYRIVETTIVTYELYKSLKVPILFVVGGLDAGVTNEWIEKNGPQFKLEGLPVPKAIVFSAKSECEKFESLYVVYRTESFRHLATLVFKEDYKMANKTIVDKAITTYKKKMELFSTASL